MSATSTGDHDSHYSDDFWRDSFKRHYNFIVERMSPDFGLIDILYSSQVLSNEERSKIIVEPTFHQRNRTILEYIKQKSAHGKLIKTLRHSDQSHLINYLKSLGKYRPEFDGEWPLREKEILTLDTNFDVLVDLLDTIELGRLYALRVINNRQKEFISTKQTSFEKNGTLLEILRRGSVHSYFQTMRWLRGSKQERVLEIFENGGVVVPVHSQIDGDDGRTEEEIINNFANVLRDRPLDVSLRILEGTSLVVLALKKGQSIVIYIYCKTLMDLEQLNTMFLNGELRSTVQTFFAQFVCQTQATMLRVDNLEIAAESVSTHLFQQKGVKDIPDSVALSIPLKYILYFFRPWKGSISETLLNQLPLELLDFVLKKAILFSILSKHNSRNGTDDHIIRKISVDMCWFERITKRRFKKEIWSYLKKNYENVPNSSMVFRNSRQFVQETFQFSKELIGLKRFDCLSDYENAIINRKLYLKNVKGKHLRKEVGNSPALAKFCDDIKLDALIRCLSRCGESFMEQTIINTEAVIKVEFRKLISWKKSWSLEQNVKRCLNKLATIGYATGNISTHSKDMKLKILRTVEDRETVVWIWLSLSRSVNKSQIFTQQIREMVKEKFCAESFGIFNIDSDQLKKEFNTENYLELVQTIRTRAAVKYSKGISAVVIVKDKLFISSFQATDIEIYDLESLVLTNTLKLPKLVNAYDMKYCCKNDCLYVMDTKYLDTTKEIIRISPEGKLLKAWTTGYGYGCITVTFDSNVLLATYDQGIEEFSPNGVSIDRFALSSEQGFPHSRYAIKLRSGHYLISHGDDDDPFHRICEVDRNGNVFASFGGKRGSNTNQLNIPIFLEFYSKYSFVAIDRENSRILLLDSKNLTLQKVVIPSKSHGMNRPERLALDTARDRIFAVHNDAHWKECCVFVFE